MPKIATITSTVLFHFQWRGEISKAAGLERMWCLKKTATLCGVADRLDAAVIAVIAVELFCVTSK
jgi:hypothetical protein